MWRRRKPARRKPTLERGTHVTLIVDADAFGSCGTLRHVSAGTHGVIAGRWPDTGPDLREGWLLLAAEGEGETVHVPVLPEHVTAGAHWKAVA